MHLSYAVDHAKLLRDLGRGVRIEVAVQYECLIDLGHGCVFVKLQKPDHLSACPRSDATCVARLKSSPELILLRDQGTLPVEGFSLRLYVQLLTDRVDKIASLTTEYRQSLQGRF